MSDRDDPKAEEARALEADAALRAAHRAWQAGGAPVPAAASAPSSAGAAHTSPSSLEELAALARARGDSPERLAALASVLSDPARAREFALLVAAEHAAGEVEVDRAGGASAVGEDATVAREAATPIAPLRGRTAPAWQRLLPLAASLLVVTSLGTWWFGGREPAPSVVRGDATESVRVIGWREDALVWHRVAGASRYVVEELDADGAVLHAAGTADTVLVVAPATRRDGVWWVRAYDGTRELAASPLRQIP
jgi:hypothetical protein